MGLFHVPTFVGRIAKRAGLKKKDSKSQGNPLGGAAVKALPSGTSQTPPASSSGDCDSNYLRERSQLVGLDDKTFSVHNSGPSQETDFEESLEGATLASVSEDFRSDKTQDTAVEMPISQVVVSEGEYGAHTVSHNLQVESIKFLTPIVPQIPNPPQSGTNQTEPSKDNSRLFALIIGINKYNSRTISNSRGQKKYTPEIELPSFTNLRGAVADAENFYKYLISDLGVPSDRINLLCDERATRAEIIKGFQDLGQREDIRKGDSIVIFYAGHGAQALPPRRLSGTPGCPTYVELLVPNDYGEDPNSYKLKGIPDYTLAALLNGIAEKKGDNITVIFDCCHSASALRGPVSKPASDDEDSQPIARTGPELNYRIPDDLDVDIWGGKRALTVLPRLRHVGSASYVFFSACASSETAKEEKGRGYFTSALLTLLTEVGSRTLPCSQIITRIKKIPGQNPQCEGVHTNRSIFHGFSPSYRKRFYNVSIPHSRYAVDAGTLDGLSQGDELTVYKTQSEDDLKKPGPVFIVDKVSNRNSLLRIRDQPPLVDAAPYLSLIFRASAPALLTKSAQSRLRLYISAEQSGHAERLVSLVNRLQTAGTITIITSEDDRPTAHICLSTNDGVDLRFEVVDGDLTEDCRRHFKYQGDSADEELARILRGLTDYYWHLTRTHPIRSSSIPSDADVSISICKLRQDNKNSANPIFVPIAEATELVRDGSVIQLQVDSAPDGDSQQQYDEFATESDELELYGVKVTNNSQKQDLYPALFYFDNGDFTIKPIYQPPLGNLGNLNAESPLKRGESITIGYGAAGAGITVPPLYFSLPKGRNMDVGYLKLILSTQHIDLEDMVQTSPLFESTRGCGPPPPAPNRQPPNWTSFTIKVVQKLRKDR